MTMKAALLAATAVITIGVTVASAQPIYPPPGNDPDGYYSRSDQSGYYDRDGHYRRIRMPDNYGPPPPPPDAYGPPPPPPAAYSENCHRGNAATGTVLGALAGGLIGGAASHGNGGAIVGGAIVGGLLGNTISRDIDCD